MTTVFNTACTEGKGNFPQALYASTPPDTRLFDIHGEEYWENLDVYVCFIGMCNRYEYAGYRFYELARATEDLSVRNFLDAENTVNQLIEEVAEIRRRLSEARCKYSDFVRSLNRAIRTGKKQRISPEELETMRQYENEKNTVEAAYSTLFEERKRELTNAQVTLRRAKEALRRHCATMQA